MPTSRKFMGHGGSEIIKILSGSAVNNLSQLNDVSLSSVTDAEVLQYESSSGKWINAALAEVAGGISGSTQLWNSTAATYFPVWISGNAIGRSSLKLTDLTTNKYMGFEYVYNPSDEDYTLAKLDFVSS